MNKPATDKCASGSPRIEYHGVSRMFTDGQKDFLAVEGIELTVEAGEFICIIGPSGCGKSTLLNMAAGLLKPSLGSVRYNGEAVRRLNTQVGYVTQRDMLLPWRTAARNVELPLELHGISAGERKRRVEAMLGQMRLGGKGDMYPSQLSGGMMKRAALAQILVYEPETLLMDEPFGSLDAQLRMALQRDLLAICERDRKTVLFVTHDLEEAILLGDRVVVFGTGPGRIIHVETIRLPRPRDLVALRTTPEFTETWERLWTLLAPQIGAAQ